MSNTRMVGVRGATTADTNTSEAIVSATRELLVDICNTNPTLRVKDLASIIFTVTDDLTAEYPARAARQLGWVDVPLLCAREIPVPGELSHCIRVLIHWNTQLYQNEVQHVYLKDTIKLRPDLNQHK
ncbi:MAG: chorismate mutase [Chloroflexota bacterium]|nr:chorismate mutase [Chloroflexota bacterium]